MQPLSATPQMQKSVETRTMTTTTTQGMVQPTMGMVQPTMGMSNTTHGMTNTTMTNTNMNNTNMTNTHGMSMGHSGIPTQTQRVSTQLVNAVEGSPVPSYVTTQGNASVVTFEQVAASNDVQYTGHSNAYTTQKTVTETVNTVHQQPIVSHSTNVMTTGESRVVGREVGEHRLLSVTERVDESRSQVLNERYTERQIRVPKKIVREELIETVIVVPEKRIVEEEVQETQVVRQKVIEIAKPTIVEKIIEVPEIEYVERIIEVPEKKIEERLVEKAVAVRVPNYVDVPVIQRQERVVNVDQIQYRDVEVVKEVEEPVWRDEIIIKDVPVPKHVEVPVPEYVDVETPVFVHRDLPVPIEAEVVYEYRLPQLKPRYAKVSYPVYLPRFIEVPVAMELLQGDLAHKAEAYLGQVNMLTKVPASLCEVEGLAANIMMTDFQSQISNADLQTAVLKAWSSGNLAMDHQTFGASTAQKTTTTTTTTTVTNK